MSKPSLLIVDDDNDLRGVLVLRLNKKGFHAVGCCSAEDAIEQLKKENFDLVLSDLKMEGASGIDLLRWVKKNQSKPFLLMSGFSDIKSTDEALALGAEGFLPKPFRFSDLMETIQNLLGNTVDDTLVHRADDFKSVPISTLLSGCEIPFHIYLKMSDTKFIKIAYSGEDISESRLESYKNRGVKSLYLQKEDHSKFLGFNISLTSGVVSDSSIPVEKKREFVKAVGKSVFDKVSFSVRNPQELEVAAEFLETATDALVESSQVFNCLEELMNNEDILYGHSLSVSILAQMISKKLGRSSPHQLFVVSVGGLLHDIGKSDWPAELIAGEVENLSVQQKEMIKNHTELGAKKLRSYGSISTEILEIVENHHELISGAGTPKGLVKAEISVAAQIVGVADHSLNLQHNASKLNLDPNLALRQMSNYQSDFDPLIFDALLDIFGFEPFRKNKISA